LKTLLNPEPFEQIIVEYPVDNLWKTRRRLCKTPVEKSTQKFSTGLFNSRGGSFQQVFNRKGGSFQQVFNRHVLKMGFNFYRILTDFG